MEEWTPPNTDYPPPKTDEPALHRAARGGDHDAIRSLIASGTDPNEVFDLRLDPMGKHREATPLMVASGSGDGASVSTINLLIELGADPTRSTDAGSAADFACAGLGWNYKPGGDTERLEAVLRHGAPLPAEPADQCRIVCDAAGSGDADRLRILLDAGLPANPAWTPDAGTDRAAEMKQMFAEWGGMDDLLDEMTEELRDGFDESMAAQHEEMAKSMAAAPWPHEIPLFRAAESGNTDCVRMLIEAGADPRQRDCSQRTAMYEATSEPVVRALLDAGVPIEDGDQFGWSPLSSAVGEDEEGLPKTRSLLACGANPNATHDRGYTVFMRAVGSSERDTELLRLLIEAGADPHAVTELGYNAFHAAIDVNGEANEESSVRSTLTYLKELGVDIEHTNELGQTPLARAISDGNAFDVLVLCELGADPDAPSGGHVCDAEGCRFVELPPLIAAIDGTGTDSDRKAIALLDAGADPLAKTKDGHTALSIAVSKLCEDAADYEGSFRRFFKGLGSLRMTSRTVPSERPTFVADALPTLKTYVEGFASDIPITGDSGFESEWRTELVATLVHLAAHEGWARHQRSEAAGGPGNSR